MQIIFQFDVRTVALFVGLTFFIEATAIGAQAYLIRDLKQYQGVGAALLANLCVAVGLMLRLFADQLPVFLITLLSNVLLLTGPGLFYIALSQFTGLTYSKAFVIGLIVTVLSLLAYFTFWQDEVGKRIMVLSLGSMAMVFILVYQVWRIRQTALQFSANLMLAFFLVYATFLILRTISFLLNPPQDNSNLTPVQSATYLLSFALSFFWSMGFILMVSQRLRNDLMEMATIDVLTRLPNRRATQAFLEKELSRVQRHQSEFTVLLVDIDDFKHVNDRWGHAVGDDVLFKTASIFHSMIRKQDLVGRWGGEEFLIVVPGPCNGQALAERVRSEIEAATFSSGSTTFGITVSIGVTCARPSDQIDQVLKKADDALYQSKRTKNAVSMAEGE
jgi:diguanylate cyclase (GGDEF)-like protein